MVEVKLGKKTVDLPYTLRIPGVSEEQFDELVDEDTKAELIDGVMVVHSPTTIEHDDIGGFIRGLMGFYADANELGSVFGPDALVHLATCRRFCPDAFFIRKERVPHPRPKEYEGTPDFVLELLSPSNRDDDLEDKRPAYRAAGVAEIWYVDPENRQLLIDSKQRRRYSERVIAKGNVTTESVAGFWLNVSWLWADPLPNRMRCLRAILKKQA